MSEIARENFYQRLDKAPYAAQGFFESIIEHFAKSNAVEVHHTDTNGGDLRLAIRGELLGQKDKRNFATMYWQAKNMAVFARTFLNPEELTSFGFDNASVPKAETEPLKSDIHLGEEVWRYGALGFIRALEAAKIKMLN